MPAQLAGTPAEASAIRSRFQHLVASWKAGCGPTTAIEGLAMHPAYQQIIGMGPAVLPLLLAELERAPDHWFWALRSIAGEDPIPEEACGDLELMTQAWLAWGKQHGYR